MQLTDLLTQSDTVTLITRIGESAAVLTADIHLAACSTLDHARAHGDWTGITRLMDTLPKSQRVQALKVWYSHFSNGRVSLSTDPDTKAWRVNKDKFGGRSDADFAVQDAMETTYADLTPEKDPTTLSVEKFLKSLARTATNAENFPNTDVPKVSLVTRDIASRIVAFVKNDAAIQAAIAVK
jgi:hypothetical protein